MRRVGRMSPPTNALLRTYFGHSTPSLVTPISVRTLATSTQQVTKQESPGKGFKSERFADRAAFEEGLIQLEQAPTTPIAPRLLVRLLVGSVVGRSEGLRDFLPRVVALHERVQGGSKFDATGLLASLSYVGELEPTFAEYERQSREQIGIHELNYGYLVEAASAKGDLPRAMSVVDLMQRDRALMVEPRLSTFVFNRLILACGKNRKLGTAGRVFTLMHEAGLRPTRTTFSSYIDACAMAGDLRQGLTVLNHMKPVVGLAPEKYRLDARYFTSLIPACKTQDELDRIVAEMIREGVDATDETLSALIAGCSANPTSGGLSRALKMFQELRVYHHQQQREEEHERRRRKVVIKPFVGSIHYF